MPIRICRPLYIFVKQNMENINTYIVLFFITDIKHLK